MAVIKSGNSTDQLTVDTTSKAARVTLYNSSGSELSSLPVSGSVTVSNFPATQNVAITSSVEVEVKNDSGSAIPVSGTFFQATQPVSIASTINAAITNFPASTEIANDIGNPVPVSGTFFQATQPISAASLPLPSGASTSANQALQMQDATFTGRINTQGQKTMATSTPVVLASDQSTLVTATFVKATYRAATATANNGVVVTAASAAPFFALYGSATKTITVQRIFVSGSTLTAVAYLSYVLAKYSTAITGGTAVALTQVPLNAASAAGTASICNVYTAAPTAGTLIGPISTKRTLAQSTTAAAAGSPDIVEFDFRTSGSPVSGIVLNGTAQGIALNFGAAPATAVTLAIAVEWTEE